MAATEDEARSFAQAFRSFLEWVHTDERHGRRNEVVALLHDFLGPEGRQHSVVSRALAPFEHVNLQTAIDAWSRTPGRTVELHGIAVPPHYEQPGLQQLVAGEGIPALRLSAPSLVDLPNGPDSTLACHLLSLLLVTDEHGRYAVLLAGPSEHDPGLRVDVAVEIGLSNADARGRLFALYGRDVPFEVDDADVAAVVERTEGVTASFLRELVRRSVLQSLHDHDPLRTVTAAHTNRALEDLLHSSQQVTRSLLGVGNDPETLPPGGDAPAPVATAGWVAYTGRAVGRAHRPF